MLKLFTLKLLDCQLIFVHNRKLKNKFFLVEIEAGTGFFTKLAKVTVLTESNEVLS